MSLQRCIPCMMCKKKEISELKCVLFLVSMCAILLTAILIAFACAAGLLFPNSEKNLMFGYIVTILACISAGALSFWGIIFCLTPWKVAFSQDLANPNHLHEHDSDDPFLRHERNGKCGNIDHENKYYDRRTGSPAIVISISGLKRSVKLYHVSNEWSAWLDISWRLVLYNKHNQEKLSFPVFRVKSERETTLHVIIEERILEALRRLDTHPSKVNFLSAKNVSAEVTAEILS